MDMRKLTSVLLFWALSLSLFAQNGLRVEAPAVVGLDERFNVTFIIEGDERPSSFDWSAGEGFRVEWGPQTGTSTSIQIINGKRSKTSQTTYTYILSPVSTGKFRLPQATARVGREELRSKDVEIEVVTNGASSQGSSRSSGSASRSGGDQSQSASSYDIADEDLFLKLTLSKRNVVVGEPVTATLKLYQRVNVTGFEDARFPVFNGFWSQETEAPTNIQFSRESIDDKIYDAALIRRFTLIPQKSGDLKIDPAELICLVNVRTQSRPTSIFDEFFDSGYRRVRKRITTPPVTVHVSPLPSGAPASFGGGVGSFSIDAKLSKDQVKANDATSLLVTVSGRGNVSLLEAPEVSFHPDMEVYDVKVTDNSDKSSGGLSGSKTFEYPFIPRSQGDFTIPPVEYSYYDSNAGKYVTLRTQELNLSVAKGDSQSSQGGTTLNVVERKGVKSLAEDIRYISLRKPSFEEGGDFLVGRPAYWICAAFLLLLATGLWLGFRKMAVMRADVAGSRTRKASRVARKRLALAEQFLGKKLSAAFYEELHRALLGYVSDKLGMTVESLSRDNISSQLLSCGVPEETAGRFVALLEACEYARYAPDAGNEAMNAHYQGAVELISSIESCMKNHRNGAGKASAVLVLLLTLPGMARAEENSPETLWNEGVSAYEEGRWNDAASAWESLPEAGCTDAVIYYNAGNAWYKAGEYPRAILCYERALKEDVSFADARFNLEIARQSIQDSIDEVPEFIFKTWMRRICNTLSSDSWAVLSLVMLALTLAMLLLFLLSSTPAKRRTGFYTAIAAFLLTILSFSMAKWQHSSLKSQEYAIVMSPVSSVRSSPSAGSAKDLFVLHGGVKVKILDSVGEWTNMMLSDGRQGWIRSTDIEII